MWSHTDLEPKHGPTPYSLGDPEWFPAAAAAKSLQSFPTLWDPTEGSPSGSPVPGILQARTLEWVAISFSSAWKWKVKVRSLSHVWLLATLWTAAHQALLSMGFSRQEYWSGLPFPAPHIVSCLWKTDSEKTYWLVSLWLVKNPSGLLINPFYISDGK